MDNRIVIGTVSIRTSPALQTRATFGARQKDPQIFYILPNEPENSMKTNKTSVADTHGIGFVWLRNECYCESGRLDAKASPSI
jgi:hypothetical protein